MFLLLRNQANSGAFPFPVPSLLASPPSPPHTHIQIPNPKLLRLLQLPRNLHGEQLFEFSCTIRRRGVPRRRVEHRVERHLHAALLQQQLLRCHRLDQKFARNMHYVFCGNVTVTLMPVPPVLPPAGSGQNKGSRGINGSRKRIIIVATSVVAAALLLLFVIYLCRRKQRKQARNGLIKNGGDEREIISVESLLLDLATIKAATNNFSEENKLGEGGFGPVYKGILQDGQEIAVKRLSMSSAQGLDELKNEVVIVAKLQHKNLVRLIGCCIEEQERLLVYEYLPNTSLDKFLFVPARREQLDWGTRYKIIEGISRGLLYLHEDLRLKIIHRDLKASNILLDAFMIPKISDFGLAKLFDVDASEGNTSRIAGTYGYMAPEYVIYGHFSTKSDVFAFGVLILEIVTGQRIDRPQESLSSESLLSYVWKHWTKGTAHKVLDPSLMGQCRLEDVLRCIHIALLCVQEDPSDRPKMESVVLMLNSLSITLPALSTPAFVISTAKNTEEIETTASGGLQRKATRAVSMNTVTISEFEPR
uniref:Protein kinase domain-containing protein n=1 Tax=Ananas comosus var. bracteatus TaxID=296719 RepID=A0A6V7NYG9_ANACO|nr:unnamed protein product [Ananas comosus var. bracteatus]